MSKPTTVPRPPVGSRIPQSIRIVVDFPAPLGPRMPKISPRRTSSETSRTATSDPKERPKDDKRVTPAINIQTSEGYTVTVDVSVLYRIEDPYKVLTTIGPGKLYEDALVIPRTEQILRKRLGELLETDLLARRDAKGLRALLLRRHRLGERGGRRADEPAGRQHVEGARPFADEVRRRIEAGAPVHASAREQGDTCIADEPRDALGQVTRVGVLGHELDERAVELLVERGEQQRQGRLRHARGRRERLGEGAEALALAKLGDERMENRLVHE